jgi:uncharacterized low-complexity protein
MKRDVFLSIMVGSVMVAGALPQASANNNSQVSKIENQAPTSSGKCASGKCGTEKIYGQADLKHDPQDQLVRARDGKCGLTGSGIDNNESPQQIGDKKCVSGVCGK